MSTHILDRVLSNYKRKVATKPPGTYSLDECATRWKCSADTARKMLGDMRKGKLVTEVPGQKVNGAGQIQATVYYRFLPAGDR